MKRALKLILIATAAVAVAPHAVHANAITEDFSVVVSPAVRLTGTIDIIDTSSFALFDPTQGTLNDIQVKLNGSATWTSSQPGPGLLVNLLPPSPDNGELTLGESFDNPGTIIIKLSGLDTGSFPELTGAGTTNLRLALTGDDNDSFATSTDGLAGSITFDFTPVSAVPEPASLALFGVGLLGLGFARRRKGV